MRDGWGLMLGRYQPWHEGHQAIFEQILKLHPAGVCILVRDSYGTSEKNPLRPGQVVERIEAALEKAGTCAYLYEIIVVPDIQGVYYGRDVGYAIEKIELPPEFTNVSATQKRKEQGLTC
jgi:nicotinamide mononucleotide adenylyltransferase